MIYFGGLKKMKKFILISMIAIAAFGVTGCGEDDGTSADIRWDNNSGDDIYEVKWVASGKVDQTWSADLANTNVSPYKGISELTGQGECLNVTDRGTGAEGTPYDVYIDGALNHSVDNNDSETLNISQVQAK